MLGTWQLQLDLPLGYPRLASSCGAGTTPTREFGRKNRGSACQGFLFILQTTNWGLWTSTLNLTSLRSSGNGSRDLGAVLPASFCSGYIGRRCINRRSFICSENCVCTYSALLADLSAMSRTVSRIEDVVPFFSCNCLTIALQRKNRRHLVILAAIPVQHLVAIILDGPGFSE